MQETRFMKPIKGITDIYDKILQLCAHLGGVLLVLITLSVAIDVLVRKVSNTALSGVVESSEYGIAFITFLSAAWILKQDGHPKLDLLINFLGPKPRALLNLVTSTIGAAMCLFLAYRGTLTVWDLQIRHVETASSMELPMAPLYIPICIGTLLLFVQFSRKAYGYLMDLRKT